MSEEADMSEQEIASRLTEEYGWSCLETLCAFTTWWGEVFLATLRSGETRTPNAVLHRERGR